MINYTEFIASTINVQSYLTEEKLDSLYAAFNVDGKGEISHEDLKNAFTKFGKNVTEQELKQMMKDHDLDGNKSLSKDEFKEMVVTEL